MSEDSKKPPLLLRENNSQRKLPAIIPAREASTGMSVKRVKTWFLLFVLHPSGKQERFTIPCGTVGSAIIYAKNFCGKKRFHKWMICAQQETLPALPPKPASMPDAKRSTAIVQYRKEQIKALTAKPELSPLMPVAGFNSGHLHYADWFETQSPEAIKLRQIWLPIIDRSTEKSHDVSNARKANQDSSILGKKGYTVTVQNKPNPVKPKEPLTGSSLNFALSDKLRAQGDARKAKQADSLATAPRTLGKALAGLAMRSKDILIRTGR